jgi:hypothetical protein
MKNPDGQVLPVFVGNILALITLRSGRISTCSRLGPHTVGGVDDPGSGPSNAPQQPRLRGAHRHECALSAQSRNLERNPCTVTSLQPMRRRKASSRLRSVDGLARLRVGKMQSYLISLAPPILSPHACATGALIRGCLPLGKRLSKRRVTTAARRL